jgi:arabinan endo-1,5-alpha-L-arabinosidase
MDFPDPAIIRVANGTFYAYAMQGKNKEGIPVNIQVAKSVDLVNWEHISSAFFKKYPVHPYLLYLTFPC